MHVVILASYGTMLDVLFENSLIHKINPGVSVMSKKSISVVSVLIVSALSTGCATITRGTTEVLVVESTPLGADVALSNGMRCKTPCSLKLKRKDAVVLDISKDGYESVQVNVLSEIAGAGAAGMAGNVLVGGIIGAGVDASTGAMKSLKPNPVKVTLVEKSDRQSPAGATELRDADLEVARQRCTSLGFKLEEFRACVAEQLKNLSNSR